MGDRKFTQTQAYTDGKTENLHMYNIDGWGTEKLHKHMYIYIYMVDRKFTQTNIYIDGGIL